jgi:very-short-patch-repair endonuclease
MTYIPYNKKLKEYSRELRNNSTLSEVLLWNYLRAGKMKGYKFNRQKPLLNYIVDFYCKDLNLVIEIDGDSHDYKYKADIIRQKEFEKYNLKFLRFEDIEVKKDIDNVLRAIEYWIEEFENNPPNPLNKGE